MKIQSFETKSVRMERLIQVSVFTPEEDVDHIMEHVCQLVPLSQGEKYDNNSYQTASGIERYRPLVGAAAGPETEIRKRPGVVEVSFEVPDNQELLEQIIEEIFQVHSYQEPVINVKPILVSRSKGLDDKDNPYRWWNNKGDWKKTN